MIAAIYARIGMLTVLGLLVVATSASAECAWVLWLAQNPPVERPGGPIQPSAWGPFEGHDSKKACEKEMNRLGGSASGNSYMMCLPDTVDPRGPKGK